MKVLLVYDSLYGNTEQIARAIGGAIQGEVKLLRVGEAGPADLTGIDLFIVGSPTQGGQATKLLQAFLSSLSDTAVKGPQNAVFDTRMSSKWMGIFGNAAGKIASSLKNKGGNLVVPPEAFFVKGNKGPLKEGELERAAEWGKKLANQAAKPG